MEVNLKVVNTMIFFDGDYIQKLIAMIGQFTVATKNTPEVEDLLLKKKFEIVEQLPLPDSDPCNQKIKLKFSRLCLVCRSKGRSLNDIVLLDSKINLNQYTTKMLLNLYVRKVGIRDLTEYPFTKSPQTMSEYYSAKKKTYVSFSSAPEKPGKKYARTLDNNGVIVLVEVAKPQYKMSNGLKIGTKAEVFLNNGELHLFLQPLFRLLDFLFNSLMPIAVKDLTNVTPIAALLDMINDPSRTLYNVFIRDLRVHMRPNFKMTRYPILGANEVTVFNRLNPDSQSRRLGTHPSIEKIPSELINVTVEKPTVLSFDGKIDFMTMSSLEVEVDKFMFGLQWERIIGQGKDALFDYFDMNNKIDVLMKDLKINFRKDDYYALMTYVFGNLSYNDGIDDILNIKGPQTEGRFQGMNVRVLGTPASVTFREDNAKKFTQLDFPNLLVTVDKDTKKDQIVKIYGPNVNGDAYDYQTNSMDQVLRMRLGFIKTFPRIQEMAEGNPVDDMLGNINDKGLMKDAELRLSQNSKQNTALDDKYGKVGQQISMVA